MRSNMTVKHLLIRIALLFALAIPALLAPEASAQNRTEERMERAYERGQRHLDRREYGEAVERFDEVIASKTSRAPGAMYWRSWALYRMNKRTEALETLAALERTYPNSAWKNDGKALDLEIRQASGQRVSPDSVEDEELRLVALHSLAMNDPDRALPVVEKILAGPYSMKMKEKALFVLTQLPSKSGNALIERVARGELNPDLQLEAIEFIGVMGNAASRELLSSIYRQTSNVSVKKEIMESYMVSGDRKRLLELARGEQNAALRGKAVEQLGVMGATEELRQLYQQESSFEVKKDIIEALFVGGAKSIVESLAKTEKDPKLRKEAIEALGLLGASTESTLLEIYRSDTDREIRKEVIEALFIQGNAKALVALARRETDPRMKKEIVEQLSIMASEDARAYLMELLGMGGN